MNYEQRGFEILARTGEAQEIIGASEPAEKGIVSEVVSTAYMLGATVSGPACAYHGYKRNKSVAWALWWGFAGSVFFPIAPVIAAAQGFGKPREIDED
jgi:hypothetical protein